MTQVRARRLPAAQRREVIVEAATPLVRRQGRAVTTGQIAAAAGVSEGTLFHVFPDKDAIIDAVVDRELRPDAVLAELRALDAGLPLAQRVAAVVEVLRRRLGSVFELVTSVGLHRPPRGDAGREEANRAVLGVVAEVLTPGSQELRYRPTEAARLIRLVTFAATHPVITEHAPLSTEEIVDLLTYGILRADPSPGAKPC
ncbi:MAG TPA: TetR/AcrR family transcriptional regulator [Actinomycetes bacterium]|nr:TetR/AcrR family transcriptional regulator [Actinomycetes bacterium]